MVSFSGPGCSYFLHVVCKIISFFTQNSQSLMREDNLYTVCVLYLPEFTTINLCTGRPHALESCFPQPCWSGHWQWNSSVLLCLWHFWSRVRWSGISQQRHKSHKWRAETFCLSSVVGGVLHGRTQFKGISYASYEMNIFSPHVCFIVNIHMHAATHSQSDWMSAVILDSASFKNHICWLNCGTRGNVWESPGSTGFILWAPRIFITNPVAVHPGDRFESWHRRTRISQVWKCIIFSPHSKATSMHESINRVWQTRPAENKELNKLDRSLPWMFLKAVSHCFSRWSRQLSASSKINVDERKIIIFLNQVFR